MAIDRRLTSSGQGGKVQIMDNATRLNKIGLHLRERLTKLDTDIEYFMKHGDIDCLYTAIARHTEVWQLYALYFKVDAAEYWKSPERKAQVQRFAEFRQCISEAQAEYNDDYGLDINPDNQE